MECKFFCLLHITCRCTEIYRRRNRPNIFYYAEFRQICLSTSLLLGCSDASSFRRVKSHQDFSIFLHASIAQTQLNYQDLSNKMKIHQHVNQSQNNNLQPQLGQQSEQGNKSKGLFCLLQRNAGSKFKELNTTDGFYD